ncbi:MAG TPA: tetratricopeptide repeat protein [Vicinamibacteria bacterium]|nr:tetratricopeptide repeat protein [Vicinamibacteria bacterium]
MPFALLLVALLAASAPPEDARAALARAVALHQKGDLEGAVAAYRESLALAPSVEARSNLGAALAALGRYEEAIESYRGALAMAPSDPRIRYNLALAYYKSADLPRAAEELEALRAAQPDDLRATLLLADCRLQMGEPAAVEELLRPLAASRPDDRAVTYLLGMALVRGGKAEEGQRLVETLMRDGDSAETQYLVGSAAFMAGDYPQAVERFSRALEKNPGLPSLRSYYGRALLFTGDADGAERAFREALAASPNDYEASYFLASVLATRGRRKEARPFVERATKLRPQSDQAKELLASLDRPETASAPADVSPLVGHPAPDVELFRPDGTSFRLSSLRGRPLVLVLGSYTCPQLRHGAPAINRLHERYGDRVRFLLAYLREAHPAGEAWESTINRREGIQLPEARSAAERGEHAALCRRELKIPYEATLDGLDGKAEAAFSAFPSRVFVIDAGGTVTFSSALDVESFREQALEAAVVAAAR